MDVFLEDFLAAPSRAKLDGCTKARLILVANSFGLEVSSSIRKAEIKQLLCEALLERGVFSASPVAEEKDGDAAETKVAEVAGVFDARQKTESGSDFHSHMSTEDLRLTLRIKEVETRHKELEVQAMHLRVRALELENKPSVATSPPGTSVSPLNGFDISKYIPLVPSFRESEVDSYFGAFERIATALNWPKECWSLLLQCKLVGKAQEVCSSLSLDQSLDYEVLKKTVLQAYELVPEAYRQNFRNVVKTANQTFVEFAREKSILFDKWCSACEVKSLEDLRELILLEEFKKCLPERMVIYLNEQKVTGLMKAAVLADEFILTHKNVFHPSINRNSNNEQKTSPKAARKGMPTSIGDNRECFYCHKPGHLVATCHVLKKKLTRNSVTPTGVGFVNSVLIEKSSIEQNPQTDVEPNFVPFISHGYVSLTGEDKDKVPVTILRDTGAYQSFMLESVLQLSEETSCGSDLLVWGIKMSVLRVPLHEVHLHSPLVTGRVKVAIRSRLPISGVSFILGNDLAGGQVFPLPEVVEKPSVASSAFASSVPNVFPVCAITRAQARKMGETIDLSESFMSTLDESETLQPPQKRESTIKSETKSGCQTDNMTLNVTRDMLITAQQNDPTLAACFSSAVDNGGEKMPNVIYFMENGILMRRWTQHSSDLDNTDQLVVPRNFRLQVLSLAHDSSLAGHLGVKKTYHRILRNFFWPGLRSDVADYCRSCYTCQLVGKPNQPIPQAPLKPIPVLGEPFERVLLDCVGPLPKTKSGHQYILTVMCAATRFPEAIPLRTMKATPIVKALIK
uniref:Gypsy retrotransposon integrase-like protein 1 n=1 Tax=Oryzias latipes TaxID=8090 RepID=A0A3P9JAN5_ORYLA